MVRPGIAAALLLLLLGVGAGAAAETIQLIPESSASWGLRNVFAPFSVIFVGPSYWYGERTIKVDTTPPGAQLDLFYVRANFQKRYEQAQAPVTIALPTRIEAGPRDAVTVRAYLEGYRVQETTVPVSSRQDTVQLDLSPLPNALKAVASAYFGGRGSLSLLTTQLAEVRLQNREGGFTLVLDQTANTPELADALASVRNPYISSVSAQQLGEDLLVRVDTTPLAQSEKVELRSRQGQDATRGLHEFAIDLVPSQGAENMVGRAQAAIARLDRRDVMGCAAVFDDAFRRSLDREALTRALVPHGAYTDPYLRAVMKRLGEISPEGAVTLQDGTRLNPVAPIELAAAMSQASEVKGYLALLRAFSRELEGPEHASETLRGLVAPELEPSLFATALAGAEAQEKSCRAQ
ncbi:MAG TPA: hypothetical protein VKE73_07950 [Myxococcota bacterium]|nr:hypothetical protein [Myxococcota bacterium]